MVLSSLLHVFGMSLRLVEKREAHVVVGSRFVATICLFFLGGGSFFRRRGSSSRSSGTASGGSGHGRRRRSQVTEERRHVDAVQGLVDEEKHGEGDKGISWDVEEDGESSRHQNGESHHAGCTCDQSLTLAKRVGQ